MKEINEDRYYDSLYEKYSEEAKVPYTDYRKLEEQLEICKGQIQDIANFIRNNDCPGAYEYLISEKLI